MKTILLIGCGDIAQRLIPLLSRRYRVIGLVRSVVKAEQLRLCGVHPILGDLDQRDSLSRLSGVADILVYLAPPPAQGKKDSRLAHALAALSAPHRANTTQIVSQQHLKRQTGLKRCIYISTTGVYGDCHGEWVNETRPLAAQSARAIRRVDAEQQIRAWSTRQHINSSILRVPGIYAENRLPLSRFSTQTPLIQHAEDSLGNHIHAEDLVGAIIALLWHSMPNRVYQVCDASPLAIGEYYDCLADHLGFSRLARLPRAAAQAAHSPSLWSYMSESRRLTHQRLRSETRWRCHYPNIQVAIQAMPPSSILNKKGL